MRAALRTASTSRVFISTNESNTPMRELLRSEGWSPSGVLTGLDEGDPEHVFFHDVPPVKSASTARSDPDEEFRGYEPLELKCGGQPPRLSPDRSR